MQKLTPSGPNSMRLTQRFHVLRFKDLEEIFSEENLTSVWRQVVRYSFRDQEILDLYDYYDFTFNIENNSKIIRQKILDGSYQIKIPFIYREEKRFGICRHIFVLSPYDALILQTIVDKSLADSLLEAAPTQKAYYSRERGKFTFKSSQEDPGESTYDWITNWKKAQKKIRDISEKKNYLVVTDLSNYYDSICLRELRHVVSSLVSAPEVILDLLFIAMEDLSNRPDYLPSSFRGLPVIDMEAPRLLAHSFLFEIDTILEKHTDGCFVRWMDDISFGVDSIENAYIVLGLIHDTLRSRGLYLNLGKTKIFGPSEVAHNLFFLEHDFLDDIDSKIRELQDIENLRSDLRKASLDSKLCQFYEKHEKNTNLQDWSRITKRLLTLFGKLGSDSFLEESKKLFLESAKLRKNVKYYLTKLGYSKQRSEVVLVLIKEGNFYDDLSLFHLVQILISWNVPFSEESKALIKKVSAYLFNRKDFIGFYCALWFFAKYQKPSDLNILIKTRESLWKNDIFLERQVVATLPRIFHYRPELVQKEISNIMLRGIEESMSVATNIQYLSGLEKIPRKLEMYLFPIRKSQRYSLQKYLILLACLSSKKLSPKTELKEKIYDYINDEWMLHWLDMYVY